MLAAYREYKHCQTDTTALDLHLEQCAACREVLAQQDFVFKLEGAEESRLLRAIFAALLASAAIGRRPVS